MIRSGIALPALLGWLIGAHADAQTNELPVEPWPGGTPLVTLDATGSLAQDLSVLAYEPARRGARAVLWAIQNSPARLYHLSPSGLAPGATQDSGRELRFPDGKEGPDAEGLALLPDPGGVRFLYVASERVGDELGSRLSVLRYDTHAEGTVLTATAEWNLTRDLPRVSSNEGIEGLAYIGDSALAGALLDEHTQRPYDPARYGDHARGVFFVGVEGTGRIYGYVLDHDSGGYQRIATIESGLAAVMGLEYDAANATLWAYCDDTCDNRATLLRLSAARDGATFVPERVLERPRDMPDVNNEGFTWRPSRSARAG